MRTILLILVQFAVALATYIYGQGTPTDPAPDRYTSGMARAFDLWDQGETAKAGQLFERIADAEPDKWIPNYYVAQLNTLSAFDEKDAERVKALLDKALDYNQLATALSPDNAELLIQKAMINTAWIAHDGATYGMTLAPKNAQLYGTALALDPENPRVVLAKAEWDMGSARYFGRDTAPYCQDVERALQLFDTFKGEDVAFYPRWGADRAREVLQQCND